MLTIVASASNCIKGFGDVCVACDGGTHVFLFFLPFFSALNRGGQGGWCGLNIMDKRLRGTRLHDGQ